MGDRGLCPIGDDLQTVVHKPEEDAAKKKAVLSKIDPSKEFVQGGEIFCRRCRKVKSLDMPERGVFMNCVCECEEEAETARKKREQRAVLAEKYRRMSFNELGRDYERATFERLNMSGATEEFLTAAERCEKFCVNFATVENSGRGIWLYGGEALGKTHLAACILHELERDKIPCVFTTLERVLSKLKATYKDSTQESEYEIMQRLTRVDCLIIDDLQAVKPKGRSAGESWAIEKFSEIVKSRYDYHHPTVITSRHSLREMAIKGEIPMSVGDKLVERQVVMQLTGEPRRKRSAGPIEF